VAIALIWTVRRTLRSPLAAPAGSVVMPVQPSEDGGERETAASA
jgi:hypothetical protein